MHQGPMLHISSTSFMQDYVIPTERINISQLKRLTLELINNQYLPSVLPKVSEVS